MQNKKQRRVPTLELCLKSKDPHAFDVVGYVDRVPMQRFHVWLADSIIANAIARLRKRQAVITQILISDGIAFGLRTALGEIPANPEGLAGNPYPINIGFPMTTDHLATMLSKHSTVFDRLRDVQIACFATCGVTQEEYKRLPLEPLFDLREQLAQGFSVAIMDWYNAQAAKKEA